MTAVMISIQPKWCGLIASGKKVVEIRKTRPKIKVPFKCYIYCTKDRKQQFWTGKCYSYVDDRSHNAFDRRGNGKVIGEFVCDTYVIDRTFGHDPLLYAAACMSVVDVAAYCLKSPMYGWHISELKIYDQPKEIEHFRRVCRYRNNDGSCQYEKVECGCVKLDFNQDGSINLAECLDCMSKAPQSWCYVEVQE